MKTNIKWMGLILVCAILFFWKILLTQQFSVLAQQEVVNQAYSWDHFSAATVKQGALPLWDPYTHAGRTFVGGMETGAFYPLKLLLYLWPFNKAQLFSPQLFLDFRVLTHVLAACFLFLLARELGLAGFPAFVASLCFSLGGFLSKIPWPDMMDSAIWLPLVLLFFIRATRSPGPGRTIFYACLSGLALGTVILAGRIHIVMMDFMVVVSAAAYIACQEWLTRRTDGPQAPPWIKYGAVIALIGVTAIAMGAIQLLPAFELSERAVRHIGASSPILAQEKIPYADLRDELYPRSIFAFLFNFPFPGGSIGGEGFSPYFGVLPLLLTIFGVWQNWTDRWVRYLAALAVMMFFYSLGPYSLLHGLAYSLVPYLWMARGAGRFIYLTHFAMALLAGFGAQSLLSRGEPATQGLACYSRVLMWLVIALTVLLSVPAFFNVPVVSEWSYFSFLLFLGSYGLIVLIRRGRSPQAACILIVVLILCDLNANFWMMENRTRLQREGKDHLDLILRSRPLADFLSRQPGLFRVHMSMDGPPNIGDLYGIQVTEGTTATEIRDFYQFRTTVPRTLDFLNVRYIVRRSTAGDPNPIYSDGQYKVYENKSGYPRAWVVHEVLMEPSPSLALKIVKAPDFDPLRTAVIGEPLEAKLEPGVESLREEVRFDSYRSNRFDLSVRSATQGLLVLSEIDYPGWKATVNGKAVRIHKVDGLLRGIVIPRGQSSVVFRYAPATILIGAAVSLLALISTGIIGAIVLVSDRKKKRGSVAEDHSESA